MNTSKQMARWLAIGLLCMMSVVGPVVAQDPEPPAEGNEPILTQPPLFNRWFAKTRWDAAYAVERSAGYDKLKIAEAIDAWNMYLALYPQAGTANEAQYKITTLTAKYREVPKTIGAYEEYLANCPDGDYASSVLWSLISQYMRIPDYDEVYSRYDDFLQHYGKSPYGDEAINSLAKRMSSQRNYEGALELYSELLQRYPTSDYCDDAVSSIGGIYAKAYDVDRATEAYFALADEYPYSNLVEPGLQALVTLYYRDGDVMRALELGQQFLDAFPQSRYTRYVRMYMYYAVRRARISIPGLELAMPNYRDEEEMDEYGLIQEQHDELYTAAGAAYKVQDYAQAVNLYQQFIAEYPSSDRIDDALYAIGQAFDALEAYATDAEKAVTPEQMGQVAGNWSRVAGGFQEAAADGSAPPVASAIQAYIILQSLAGSDLRDDALYKVGQDYEKLDNSVAACNAYIALIRTFPVSTWATYAVTRLNALYPKLPYPADRAQVMNVIIDAYPHHSLTDDYIYKIAVQFLLNGNVQAARDGFAQYVANYPHRSLAADALFWNARCEQLLGNGALARQLYGQIAANFLQSGLADDAHVEYQYIKAGAADDVLRAGLEALDRASEAVGEPILGYDAIARNHIMLLVPADKAIDVRGYNIPDRLEQAYLLLEQFCGGAPNGGARIEILVDPTIKVFMPGTPARVPQAYVGPPPMWRHWFEAVASAFMGDPAIAHVTQAVPGLADGAARYASVQLEDMLYTELGEVNVGAVAVRTHLADLNKAKAAGAAALNAHTRAKGTADKITADIGLGMMWSFATRYALIPGELINWEPLQGLFPAARAIPASAAEGMKTVEQKSALVAYWLNTGLGKDQTSTLRAWGLPVTAEELAKVTAAVEAAQKPAEPEGGGGEAEAAG